MKILSSPDECQMRYSVIRPRGLDDIGRSLLKCCDLLIKPGLRKSEEIAIMAGNDILKGKKILVVDDEPDVLESLEEILDECDVKTASSYESAKELFEKTTFDAAILDIMGVRGFDLLEIATEKRIPALMLTAHGLNPDNLVGSIKLGAKSYIPKEMMSEIDIYLKEIFIAKEKGIEKSANWFNRLGSFFENRFGSGWKNKDKKFWNEFDKIYRVSKDELQDIM